MPTLRIGSFPVVGLPGMLLVVFKHPQLFPPL